MPAPVDLRYLFRYRDLSADTLPEHRKVIEEKSACWWGWWKRPSEDGRVELWQEMENALTTDGQIVVGLFDSGTGEVYSAVVSAVVQPEINQLGQAAAVRPDDNEIELIPAYYRESRHSRAWMKMTEISEHPVDLFGTYSYRVRPPLPQHSPAQLNALLNKRIASRLELSSMDTTIWEIRPSQDEDKDGEFFAATPLASSPMMARTIQCDGDWILHLTDVHYADGDRRSQHRWRLEGEEGNQPTLSDAVARAVENRRQIGAIVLTGDLTFTASTTEFTQAEKGIRRLLDGYLGLTTDHLVVVPGNHDIKWTERDEYDDDADVTEAPSDATAAYREFYSGLFGTEASDHLAMSRRFCMPGGVLIDIVAVNSSSLAQGENFLAGMGRVQEAGLDEATRSLVWGTPGSALRVLALHHHLALTEDLESMDEYRTGFGIAIDAPRTLRKAAAAGVQLGIHGHKHRAFVWRSSVYELPEVKGPNPAPGSINILGGGSAGSTSTDGNSNYFTLFRLRRGDVQVELYRSRNGGSFEVMAGYRAPFSVNRGKPELGEWTPCDVAEFE